MRKLKPYSKYKAFLVENGIKQSEEAEYLGITTNTFTRKINRLNTDFNADEIRMIVKRHNLDANLFFLQ